jgi:hypothetical protein
VRRSPSRAVALTSRRTAQGRTSRRDRMIPWTRRPAVVALVTRLKSRGLKPKQIVVAAMRKLLVLCFGVLKTAKPFGPAIAMEGS